PPEWLVPCGDAAALAGRVGELLSDPAGLRAARRSARARAEGFRWEAVITRTAEAYLTALPRRAGGGAVAAASCRGSGLRCRPALCRTVRPARPDARPR